MFSVIKVVDGDLQSARFLSCVAFVYDEKSHNLAQILLLIWEQEYRGVDFSKCTEGPPKFEELLEFTQHRFLTGEHENQRLIYKEGFRRLQDVEKFVVEHLMANSREVGMAAHEDVAEVLRGCLK